MSELKKLILIVDDDQDYLEQMKLQILQFGFDVITATGREEGEDLLKTTKPDLAIFDLMMESHDSGFVLAYKAKRMYPDMPVIIATAVTTETGITFKVETEEDKSWIKADLYLEKGIRGDQLHREINKLLKL
ncbi:MAG: response regulator [Bacteroidales bacterium]|nr:response regulator [Bacteroidota bacterium]MCF8348575.1 response regulator [Bacteroidales bacterium]